MTNEQLAQEAARKETSDRLGRIGRHNADRSEEPGLGPVNRREMSRILLARIIFKRPDVIGGTDLLELHHPDRGHEYISHELEPSR